MSRPRSLKPGGNVAARVLETARGAFAVVEGAPEPGAAAQPAAEKGTAVLVPGFTGSKEDFLDLMPPLTAAGFRVIAVDGRGQHDSAGPRDESAYAQKELAADLLAQTAAVAAAYGPEHLHVLGHSFGGHVVRAALLSVPAGEPLPYASLTLMSSGPAAVAESQRTRARLLVDHLPTMDMETAWQVMRSMDAAAVEDGAAAAPSDPDWLEEFLHRRWVTTVPEQLIAAAKQLMTESDRVTELAALRLPTLVISGEVDYAWPVPWLDEMAVRLGARRVVVKGAEHSPNAERPAETAAALIDFWTNADGRVHTSLTGE